MNSLSCLGGNEIAGDAVIISGTISGIDQGEQSPLYPWIRLCFICMSQNSEVAMDFYRGGRGRNSNLATTVELRKCLVEPKVQLSGRVL